METKAYEIILNSEKKVKKHFDYLSDIAFHNQSKVLKAFSDFGVTETHLTGSTGYGYGDLGRDTLDEIYAQIFATESTVVRGQFVSGTHTLSAVLQGILKSGDEIIFATGIPYDTLHKVVGWTGDSPHSLLNRGVDVNVIPLLDDSIQVTEVIKNITDKTKIVYFQKSRGYSSRRAFSNIYMGEMFKEIKATSPEIIIMVDNCYGEFVEKEEIGYYGADILAGSLIKNPGGGLALWGGYIAGREDLVDLVMDYAVAPGLGRDMGGSLNVQRSYYHGLFLAPSIVKQAVQGAILTAQVFSDLGFEVSPLPTEERFDLIQSVVLNSPELLLEFCAQVQAASPIDSMATPYPSELPGYKDPVVMAAGAFIQGSSIELSADAPMKKPYTVYMQGGLSYEHVKYTLVKIVAAFLEKNYCSVDG